MWGCLASGRHRQQLHRKLSKVTPSDSCRWEVLRGSRTYALLNHREVLARLLIVETEAGPDICCLEMKV